MIPHFLSNRLKDGSSIVSLNALAAILIPRNIIFMLLVFISVKF
jgi:hypothetical protein